MKDLDSREKEVLQIIRNISGENEERINNIFLALMIHTLMQYASGNNSIIIPYFGSLLLKYNGDTITSDGKEANLNIFFSPSKFLKENIGQYEDTVHNGFDITEVSILRYFAKKNERNLKTSLNEEDIEKLEE